MRMMWTIRAEMRNMGYNLIIGCGSRCIGEIPHRIAIHTSCIGNGKLTPTRHSPSPSSLLSFPPYPLISLFVVLNSTITQEYEVNSSLSISSCHDQELTPSTAYTIYSIHSVQHTLSTAYTPYCIIIRFDCLLLPSSPSSLGRTCCTQFSPFAQ
jgi:hypothetical protein